MCYCLQPSYQIEQIPSIGNFPEPCPLKGITTFGGHILAGNRLSSEAVLETHPETRNSYKPKASVS